MAASSRRPGRKRRANLSRIFGRNLRRACVARGIDAAGLAKLTGHSRRTIERMLAGESDPPLTALVAVARSIDVPLADLLRDS
jgi:transcriptional regulator with XRE-family HTH domain